MGEFAMFGLNHAPPTICTTYSSTLYLRIVVWKLRKMTDVELKELVEAEGKLKRLCLTGKFFAGDCGCEHTDVQPLRHSLTV